MHPIRQKKYDKLCRNVAKSVQFFEKCQNGPKSVEVSSRSHTLLTITVESARPNDKMTDDADGADEAPETAFLRLRIPTPFESFGKYTVLSENAFRSFHCFQHSSHVERF